jgi:transcriptional regulator with XRE-family HTH domain
MRPAPFTLGQALRQARQQQRYTLSRLAQRVQKPDGSPISPQYLSDIEHDRRTPSPMLLQALARAEVILFFRKAMNLHFQNWPAFIQQL